MITSHDSLNLPTRLRCANRILEPDVFGPGRVDGQTDETDTDLILRLVDDLENHFLGNTREGLPNGIGYVARDPCERRLRDSFAELVLLQVEFMVTERREIEPNRVEDGNHLSARQLLTVNNGAAEG